MPARRSKLPVPGTGEMKDAEMIDIMETKEPWSEVTLGDGSVVRNKVVISEVWRIVGEYNPEGDPLYVVKAQVITNTIAPDHLRKPR